jgi:peptide/nickel transport system ATP-binding protein
MTLPLVSVERLERRYFGPRRGPWRPRDVTIAIRDVSFAISAGSSLGIVGESGSGKSTLARLVMALEKPDSGRVLFEGHDLNALTPPDLRALRRDFQMVFQDPYGSLDPRQSVARIIGEPLDALVGRGEQRAERIAESLNAVGLKPDDAAKFSHQFSGGQRQRIAIARALITRPKLIVADEPVSALDVSIQAQILNLLKELERRHGVTYLLISHDLAVVEYVTARLVVMYRGAIVETGATAEILTTPRHPYTQALKEAVPTLVPGRRRARVRDAAAGRSVEGAEGPGCPYAARCPRAEPRCRAEIPELRTIAPGREAACHFA